jgi:hypothetical protein
MIDKQPSELTAAECRAELAREDDINRLRGLVGFNRVVRDMASRKESGTIEGHVHLGKIKLYRYPIVLRVVGPNE